MDISEHNLLSEWRRGQSASGVPVLRGSLTYIPLFYRIFILARAHLQSSASRTMPCSVCTLSSLHSPAAAGSLRGAFYDNFSSSVR